MHDVESALSAGQPGRALQLLDDAAKSGHGGRYGGTMGEERAAARVVTLCRLGRVDDARAEAARFVVTDPVAVGRTRSLHLCQRQRVAVNRFFGACLLLVGACGSNGTTSIGAQVDESVVSPAVDAGSEASSVCTPVGPGDACTLCPPRLLPALVVQGNQILQNGRPFHFYGRRQGDLSGVRTTWPAAMAKITFATLISIS